MALNIVNVGYDSTNYYVIADARPRLLVDVGFPGTLPKLRHQCQRMGIDLQQVAHFLITHYHPDHAGLAGELQSAGCKLMVLDVQLPAIPTLATYMKPEYPYVAPDPSHAAVINLAESRAYLAQHGIPGEVLHTRGHSADSITLLLDMGTAFTGDLGHPMAIGDNPVLRESWQTLRSAGAKRICPGHGPVWTLE